MAEKHGERLLSVDKNRISMACSLTNLDETVFKPNGINATYFGSYLFSRRVSGVRVVNSSGGKLQEFGSEPGLSFVNYGSHADAYPVLPFFTAAAALGQTKQEIDLFIVRLDEAFTSFKSQRPPGI